MAGARGAATEGQARWRTLLRRSLVVLAGAIGACGIASSPNPPGAEATNTFFTSFDEASPRYLDPTSSYARNETPFTYQIYEQPYRYNYLKRPYELEGRAAERVAPARYYDAAGRELPATAPAELVAQSVYDIAIRPGIRFAPHPAFARSADGSFAYHHLAPGDLAGKNQITDFVLTGTRELTAEDFVYSIKRLATPRVKSPAFSVMSKYIIGLAELSAALKAADRVQRAALAPTERDLPFLDLRQFPLEGASAPDPHTLRIRIHGKNAQLKYWLSMTFFAPIPWEAEEFYAQKGMAEHNFSLNTWPAGTGPYMATEYLENRRHVLVRNPYFHGEPYPCTGDAADAAAGLLQDCGKTMPFIDRVVYTIEKERIPTESKFLQGFYDEPDLIHPEWGVRFRAAARDSDARAREFSERGITFPRGVEPQVWYIGFNWWDPVVGRGVTPEQQLRNRKLRQALQIAVNWEEWSEIFEATGWAGMPAMGPVPPGVFGYRDGAAGIDPIAYDWVDAKPRRKPIAEAQKLLAEAGYPGGRNATTGQPLVLNYDYQRIPTPEYRAQIEWVVKQFAKLGIELEIRATDYNRFQDKMDNGAAQIFWWGWFADYPDAENFLYLLYGPNSKAATHGNGENTANYQNDEYDRLFAQMKNLDDGPERQAIIDRMVRIVQDDSPWLWGYFPYSSEAFQPWVRNGKPSQIVVDVLEYRRIDPVLRVALLERWNRPIFWPLALLPVIALLALLPAWRGFRARERASALPPGPAPPAAALGPPQ